MPILNAGRCPEEHLKLATGPGQEMPLVKVQLHLQRKPQEGRNHGKKLRLGITKQERIPVEFQGCRSEDPITEDSTKG